MTDNNSANAGNSFTNVKSGLSRRRILQSGLGATALGGLAAQPSMAQVPFTFDAPTSGQSLRGYLGQNSGHPVLGGNRFARRNKSTRLRMQAALSYKSDPLPEQKNNGDEGAYSDKRGSYSKALPHDSLGEVDADAFRRMIRGLTTGRSRDMERVPLAAARRLANPLASYKFEMTGVDSHQTWMRPAPTFLGKETSAEMGELYWKALCRDVNFSEYDSNPLITAAVADLNAFEETVGPKDGGSVTSGTVFRGETPGDATGPYITQLLFKDIPYGNGRIVQQYDAPAPGDDFMTTTSDWLGIQNGVAPTPLTKGGARYITDARALGEYVHTDFSFQAYLSAALIILGIPGSFDIGNIYISSTNQGAFVSLGGPDVLDLVTKAGNLALTGAWYQKWLVHRRARPEVYGGRLHNQIFGAKDYGLPDEIMNSDAVQRTVSANGSAFLSQAFPEGSPTHPSYPAGHATIAGACCTVLKAFFEESMPIPDPVVPDSSGANLVPYFGPDLTIGGEINKLANNIALGRDWAGVHFRSDGVDGLAVGEQQAIGLLRDYSLTYRERFAGFTLTKFDGSRITIENGVVLSA
ncbi:vanadium-dependent haloperoxidase [Litorimonas sp. WD9-15]|uniref:vanadium-dependent haloperoxidase n=1 Tax=Litorimonas sp. WD9-15 TaxID=3418716 RepID=UPI003D011680